MTILTTNDVQSSFASIMLAMMKEYAIKVIEVAGAKYYFHAEEAKLSLIYKSNKETFIDLSIMGDTQYNVNDIFASNIKMSTPHTSCDEKIEISYSSEIKKESKKKGSNKNAIENEHRFVDRINGPNDDHIKKEISGLLMLSETEMSAKKINKKNGCNVRHTAEWGRHKEGTKERCARAKADIQIFIHLLKKKLGISLKSGKGRITSADCHETRSIFKSVLLNKYNGIDNNELKNIIVQIIDLINKLPKYKPIKNNSTLKSIREEMERNHDLNNPDTEWVNSLDKTTEECNHLWNELKNNHAEFVKDVLYEATSGEYKFGDNDGRADILIVTKSSDSQEIHKIFDLSQRTEKLDNYLAECAKGKNPFKCKSGGTGKEMWIRFL